MMAKGRYDDVTMKISVWDKDMQVIGDYARKIRVPTPIFNATKGDLREGHEERPRRQRHRRGLRGAGKDGEGKATQTRGVISPLHQSSMAGLVPAIERFARSPPTGGRPRQRGHGEAVGGRDGVVAAANGNPRRHADRLGRADHDGRRPGAARRRLSPGARRANIRSSSATAPTPRASPSRTAIRARGSA